LLIEQGFINLADDETLSSFFYDCISTRLSNTVCIGVYTEKKKRRTELMVQTETERARFHLPLPLKKLF
jgi:hypothetical protein